MALRVTRHGLDAFEACAMPFLLEREAEHNLIIGLCGAIRAGRYRDPYLAVVEDEQVVAAVLRTPPHQATLSHVADPQALPLIADDLHLAFGTLPAVLVPTEAGGEFVRLWTARSGQRAALDMAQRIHRAERVRPPEGVRGEMREATPGDLEVVAGWTHAFEAEALGEDGDRAATTRRVEDMLRSRRWGIVLWWAGGAPVSMAGYGGPTPNGIRVNLVYTPPALRGRGYASACVAALTQRLLDTGRRFCFLFTDLANPTSNAIYRRVGYEPVCDVDRYRFDEATR